MSRPLRSEVGILVAGNYGGAPILPLHYRKQQAAEALGTFSNTSRGVAAPAEQDWAAIVNVCYTPPHPTAFCKNDIKIIPLLFFTSVNK